MAGKDDSLLASNGEAAAPEASTSMAASNKERIYVDNSSATELKMTCDDAVERILTRTSMASSLAPAPQGGSPYTSGASSPSSPTSPASSTMSLPRMPDDGSAEPFPAFKASHFHTDLRLALGFSASAIMFGTSIWAYLVQKDWDKNKGPCGVAVVVYLILSAFSAIDAYRQGNTIFAGKRKMLSKRIETERLVIASPPLPKPVTATAPAADGKRYTTPPVYSLVIDYTRKSNGGKSLLREARGKRVELGHMGEWFTEEGEFCEDVFEQRLISSLDKAFGQ